jgi:hypothetical protein
MAIILRSDKGDPLTYAEMDGNFVDLNTRVISVTTLASTPVQWDSIQNKPDLFGGNYDFLTNKPTIPVNLQDLGNCSDTGATIGQVLQWSGTEWGPADESSTVDLSSYIQTGTANAITENMIFEDVVTSRELASGAVDTGVDTHLNQSSATSNQILSWDGSDYEWVDQAGSGASYSDSDAISAVTGSDLDMGGNKVLFGNVYSTEAGLPDASVYHGMFAHVHGTGAAYFAHSGSWVQLANNADIGGSSFSGSYTDLTNKPTIPTDVNELSDNDGLLGGGGSSYTDGNVDTHLNTSGASSGQILSWDGSDYAWVADQTAAASANASGVVYDLADPSNTVILYSGDAGTEATFAGDVIKRDGTVVVDVSSSSTTFTGTLAGTVAGNSTTPTGSHTILNVGTDGTDGSLTINDITANGDVDFTDATVTISNFTSAGTGNLSLDSAASVNITATDDVNINGTANFDSVFKLTPLSSAPTSPEPGTFAVADNVNWDPASSGTSRPYPVFWDGQIWVNLY